MERSPSGLPSWLYLVIVGALAAYFVIGGITWSVLILDGRDVPDSFSTILATIAGGLVGILTKSGPSPPPSSGGS